MADWPFPTALSSYFTREQEMAIEKRMSVLKVIAADIVFVGLLVAIFLVLSLSINKSNERIQIGVAVVLGHLLMVFFFAAISRKTSPIRYEADVRTHGDWKRLFSNADTRARQSLRYRLLRWYRTQPSRTSRTGVVELESQGSTQHPPASAFRRQISTSLSKLCLSDILPFLRTLLCAAELELVGRVDRVLSGYVLQSLTIALTFVPVRLSLFLVPGLWVYYTVRPVEKRLIMTDVLSAAAWLTCMGLLLSITLLAPMMPHRGVGLAAVALVAIQPPLILCMVVDRELAWLAEQWQKSLIKYYDLFESRRDAREELPDNCFSSVFAHMILNPLRDVLDWFKSRY